jgi:hypothetical protein
MNSSDRPAGQDANEEVEFRQVQIPPRHSQTNLLTGIYANQAVQMSSVTETILDFGLVIPDEVRVNDAGRVTDVTLIHELVARVLMPTSQFNAFVLAYVRNNAEIRRTILAEIDEKSE